MELMEVYHEAMAVWIIARVTSGKCEGAAFFFGLIESAIRKEATEILLTPVQELDMVRMDFGRLHCYYRQPEITRAQFAYLAIYLVLIGNLAAEKARTERLFRGSDEGLYNLQFGKMRLPDNEPAVVIYIEPVRPKLFGQFGPGEWVFADHCGQCGVGLHGFAKGVFGGGGFPRGSASGN